MRTKSRRPDEHRTINRFLLVKIYKEMKLNPNKIFVLKDFFTERKQRDKYFGTLKLLGLIEQKKMVWKAGKNYLVLRHGIGYKLK